MYIFLNKVVQFQGFLNIIIYSQLFLNNTESSRLSMLDSMSFALPPLTLSSSLKSPINYLLIKFLSHLAFFTQLNKIRRQWQMQISQVSMFDWYIYLKHAFLGRG